MASPSTQTDYAAFEEKVKRTVYLDNLSPHITEPVVRSALNQFGNVKSVHFIPNYIEPRNIPQCALVEMEDLMQAEAVVSMTSHHYFMVSGMPRPVRAHLAEANMFADRSKMPGRTLQCQWLDENDPDFKVAQKIKDLTRLNAAQSAFLLKVFFFFNIIYCILIYYMIFWSRY